MASIPAPKLRKHSAARSRLSVLLVVIGTLATAAHAQTPRFDLVGKLDGSAYSVVLAVNDDGRGGGFSYDTRGEPMRSFLWNSVSGRNDVSTSTDGRLRFAVMSRDLTSFAGFDNFTSNVAHHRFGGVTRNIPSVFGRGAAPAAISADGNHFAGWEALQAGLRRPIAWNETTGMRLLPARPGDDSEAHGISDNGQFIVGIDWANNAGWLYSDATGYTILPNAINDDQYYNNLRAVSSDGRTVIGGGAAEISPGVVRGTPMRWIDGVPQSLGLIEGFAGGYATGFSDDGSVIVGELVTDNWSRRAFVWTADRGMSLLTDYLASMGVEVPTTPYGLIQPVVSSNGQVFGGVWSIPTTLGQTQGFVAVIPAPCTPLLILALATLAARRRR